jgi:hypothetical protein
MQDEKNAGSCGKERGANGYSDRNFHPQNSADEPSPQVLAALSVPRRSPFAMPGNGTTPRSWCLSPEQEQGVFASSEVFGWRAAERSFLNFAIPPVSPVDYWADPRDPECERIVGVWLEVFRVHYPRCGMRYDVELSSRVRRGFLPRWAQIVAFSALPSGSAQ